MHNNTATKTTVAQETGTAFPVLRTPDSKVRWILVRETGPAPNLNEIAQ